VYISPDGSRAYVANANANDVAVIDTATNTVTATIPAGSEPVGVLVSGTTAFVADAGSNTVAVIDTATNTVTATIPVGSTPFAMALGPVFQPSAASSHH
jgi:YVTN family beta-propeller protein